MNLLFYAKARGEEGLRLLQVIEESFPEGSVEIFRTADRFARRLRQPGDDEMVAVVLAADREDLNHIFGMQSLLENMRLVLILPSRQKGMIAMAHRLRPRYLAFKDGDFGDVAAVLTTMAKKAGGAEKSAAMAGQAGSR